MGPMPKASSEANARIRAADSLRFVSEIKTLSALSVDCIVREVNNNNRQLSDPRRTKRRYSARLAAISPTS